MEKSKTLDCFRVLPFNQDVVGDRPLLCPHHRDCLYPHTGRQGLEQGYPWWSPQQVGWIWNLLKNKLFPGATMLTTPPWLWATTRGTCSTASPASGRPMSGMWEIYKSEIPELSRNFSFYATASLRKDQQGNGTIYRCNNLNDLDWSCVINNMPSVSLVIVFSRIPVLSGIIN